MDGWLKVGDIISTDKYSDVKVEAIDIHPTGGEIDGPNVLSVERAPWDIVENNVAVSLDNGKWCYGHQIKRDIKAKEYKRMRELLKHTPDELNKMLEEEKDPIQKEIIQDFINEVSTRGLMSIKSKIKSLVKSGKSKEDIIKTIKANLQLHELTSISNNSRVTNELLVLLNSKLEGNDFRVFKEWIKIVRENK